MHSSEKKYTFAQTFSYPMNHGQKMYVRKASAGSGKTYTLAAHYIALLLHGESFQSILAVTFTNKATAEMKERILGYLYAIGYHSTEPSTQRFMERVREITKELGYDSGKLTDDFCIRKARDQHAQILSRYDDMRVQTIDAFLQSLLAGMVQTLGGSVGYQVELDVNRVISDAVDELLTEGAKDDDVLHALIGYMDERLVQEKNWDIRQGLNDIGKELYKEFLQEHRSELVFDQPQLNRLKENFCWKKMAASDIASLKTCLASIGSLSAGDFAKRGKDYMSAIARVTSSLEEKISKKEDVFRAFTKTCQDKIENPSDFAADCSNASRTETIRLAFVEINEIAPRLRNAYFRDKYVTHYINDMVLMGALQKRINAHLSEANTRLLADTASVLARALQDGDADFILEKAGIRYRHIMLDEFQDTSTLQWTNFEKLLREILSSYMGSTLIVGDIKQSIYRWRNGDWTIMRDLKDNWKDYFNTETPQLTCNFRSEKNVVQFNLDTMREWVSHESSDIQNIYNEGYDGTNIDRFYRQGHDGGYVRVRCYTQSSDRKQTELRNKVRTNILKDMFTTIEQLLEQQVSPSQIMILLRTNAEAKFLMDTWQNIVGDHDMFAKLSQTPIVSSNCFQLQFSPLVNLLVAGIRYIYTDDGAALAYLRQYAPDVNLCDRAHILRTMALTDLVELLIEECILATGTAVSDLSYVNSFRDILLSFVSNQGSDGLAFLRYWDDTMASKTIPAVDVEGIRLMTIHAAKGLEAENVFIPFCNWKMEEDKPGSKLWCQVLESSHAESESLLMPIPQDSNTPIAGFEDEYRKEHYLMRVDNLNLLYVALTRAAGRLFVYAPVTINYDAKKTKKEYYPRETWDVGQLMAERCKMWDSLHRMFANEQLGGENDYVEFTIGDPAWKPAPRLSETDLNPFSFQSAERQSSICHSSSSRIEFRQSQDSRNYGWSIASISADQQSLEQRALGTICHDILSTIRLYASLQAAQEATEQAVERAYRSGVIPTETIRLQILSLLKSTVTALAEYFTGEWFIQCEEVVLFRDEHGEMEERRMDRVMWSKDRKQAVVLDYKFGQDNPKYDNQVRHYMHICRQMGAVSVRGFLWIAAEQRLEEVICQ